MIAKQVDHTTHGDYVKPKEARDKERRGGALRVEGRNAFETSSLELTGNVYCQECYICKPSSEFSIRGGAQAFTCRECRVDETFKRAKSLAEASE